MLDAFTVNTFKEGEYFRVHYDGTNVLNIVLFQATSGKYKLPNSMRQPFSLLFKGPKEVFLPQGTYRIEHSRVGTFDMFITPVMPPGGDQKVYYYEAVFA